MSMLAIPEGTQGTGSVLRSALDPSTLGPSVPGEQP